MTEMKGSVTLLIRATGGFRNQGTKVYLLKAKMDMINPTREVSETMNYNEYPNYPMIKKVKTEQS
jgi:hypothetical protein